MEDKEFLKLLKESDPDYENELAKTGFIDTGCYALNALISGSIYGGIPDNRVVAFAGEEATGKTFFAMSALKTFLENNPTGRVMYYDTEFALDAEFFEKRGIDSKRVFISQPVTLEDFRTKTTKFLNAYEKMPERKPLMFVLDSLGNLPSKKEIEDAEVGKDVRDMTKTQIIKSIFRILTQKLGKLSIPMITTNHTYAIIGAYVPTKEMSGGSGLKYAASTILFLSKKKDKDGTDVVGNIIRVKTDKSRFSKESQQVELRLDFKKGLDKYYGLLPLAEKYDIIKKVSTRYELPDGTKVWGKDILKNPQKVFTQEILDQLDVAARKEYSLGDGSNDEDDTELELDDNFEEVESEVENEETTTDE